MLRGLGLSRQRYHEMKKIAAKPRFDKYAEVRPIMEHIFNIHEGDAGKYTIAADLREYNVNLCVPTVKKLMNEWNLIPVGVTKVQEYSSHDPSLTWAAPYLLNRDFGQFTRPLEGISGDVTSLECGEKNMFLSANMDLFCHETLGYSMSRTDSVDFVIDSIEPFVDKITQPCVFNTDQGKQYKHPAYRLRLADNKFITQSMSRKGNTPDNAPIESFFARLKKWLYRRGRKYATCAELEAAVHKYMYYYNFVRKQEALNWMTPVQFRDAHSAA